MTVIDGLLAACLVPVAVWIFASGIDDLFLDFVWLWGWVRRRVTRGRAIAPPPEAALDSLPERRIAVFIPLWNEHEVIGRMLDHNIAAIRYRNYEIFAGAYPNDGPTIEALEKAASRFPRLHLAIGPHAGPTSKADCLNFIYRRMLEYERERGVEFDVVVVHDAEDLIHPEELRWIGYYSREFDMVQIPVLPLPTPFRGFTHGLYCDEFAEYQQKDIPARQMLGGFIPSNGVGTGFTHTALKKLAVSNRGLVFEPDCLTEDYECGFRLHRLGCRQLFVPVQYADGRLVATREYFPQSVRAALKQRMRWVMGISLQGWERNGWRVGFRQAYWFWRDRKGLIGNPAGILANALFVYGATTWLWARRAGAEWAMARVMRLLPAAGMSFLRLVFLTTLAMLAVRIAVRCACVNRIYGWKFALGVPLRVCWGNLLNAQATASAICRYTLAKLRHHPLLWMKTSHTYPSPYVLVSHRRRIGEILVSSGMLSESDLAEALRTKPEHLKIGEHLRALGRITEECLWQTLSVQQSIPLEKIGASDVPLRTARALPAAFTRRWHVLPFRIQEGRLCLAGTDLPSDEMRSELRELTRLQIEFRYVTPSNLRELTDHLLGSGRETAKKSSGSKETMIQALPRRSSRQSIS